jgi:hypothetical protein
MRAWGSVLAGVLLLAGCASQIMTNYVGKTLMAPILDYGPPTVAYDMGDGQRVFIWTMRQQIVIPGQMTTTGNVFATTTGSVGTASLYANTIITPPTQHSFDCSYALFARKSRNDIEGPGAWQVTGFRPPKLMCE